MKRGRFLIGYGIIAAGVLCTYFAGSRVLVSPGTNDLQNEQDTVAIATDAANDRTALQAQHSPHADPPGTPHSAAVPGWINNEGQFTPQVTRLLSWVEAGHPLDVQIDNLGAQRYAFRERRVVSEDFQISMGPDSVLPSEFRVYSGRELSVDGLDGSASLALVNGAVSMTISREGQHYLIETDADSGELYAIALQSIDNPHVCGNVSCGANHTNCEILADGNIAAVRAPVGSEVAVQPRLPVSIVYPGDRIDAARGFEAADEPQFESGTAGKPYLRNGPQYDASLRDILILMVSSKSQSGSTSGLSSKAASYFAVSARSAEIYERQLGMRYLLQEMILIASDSNESDPGNPTGTALGDDLYHFGSWLSSNRPQSTYKYGHAALWTTVYNSPGGTIGLAWTDSYGSSYGTSTQEAAYGWEVHIHELGHNVGASHTSGGVMNPSLQWNNENFFTNVSGQSYTGAMDIYNYMSYPSRPYVFGPAALRHPEEIPFGVDDTVSTPIETTISFNPLANDQVSVPGGATNTLRLVEVAQVYPKAAGLAKVVGGNIEFTPANGFTGEAWFSYTVGGNVGNAGSGWLHRADVLVTVGGNTAVPTDTPALNLTNDFISTELTAPVRINPLLNDEGTGRLWSGDVEVVLSSSDSTPESYSGDALSLINATVVSGTGSLVLEQRNMVRGSTSASDNTGYLTYTPGQNESGQVTIEYTVMDAFGQTASAQIVLAQAAAVSVSANYVTVAEDSGDVISLIFDRTAAADLAIDEWVDFVVDGTASPAGLQSDYALAGQASFDPITGIGTVLIPAGQSSTTVLMAIADDGVSEGQETVFLGITATSSLQISSGANDITIWINDNSLVYEESFDGFSPDSATWNGWTNAKDTRSNGKGGEDWFDWTLDSSGTPTSNTGPSVDHTSGNGKYFYAEASGNADLYTVLLSPAINTSGVGAGNLEFWYHMYGSGMGSLTVDLYADGALVAPGILAANSQQSLNGSDWQQAQFDISPYLPASSMQLKIRADIGSSELSDIAIDDVVITAASSSLPQSPDILADPTGCTVEQGQSVYLSVIPQGFPAPQVQWYRNGIAIPGATGASYFIPALDGSNTGTYEAAVSNSEGSLLSYPASVALPAAATPSSNAIYNAWAELNLGTGVWTPDEDPDRDGVTNIFEFAFNLDPNNPSRAGLPAVSQVAEGGQAYLELRFSRRINHASEDVQYRVETSATMATGTWDSTGSAVVQVGNPVANGDGVTETVTYRRVTPLNSSPGFIRLDVQLGTVSN